MSRYDSDPGIEGEYEPRSGKRVLKNLLGIKTKAEMDRAEDKALEAMQQAYYENGLVTAETQFTARLIQEMHKDWLGCIYEWAGEYRTSGDGEKRLQVAAGAPCGSEYDRIRARNATQAYSVHRRDSG